MDAIHRVSRRLLPLSFAQKSPLNFTNSRFKTTLLPHSHKSPSPISVSGFSDPVPGSSTTAAFFIPKRRAHSSSSGSRVCPPRAGWFTGLGENKPALPHIVKVGDPVLHEPARDLDPEDIVSERVQKIIDDMVEVMRKEPGVGLAAPQIGLPLRIIVLEDTPKYITYVPEEDAKEQDRNPFDLLVIVNPKLKNKGNKRALFFEGCLSVEGFRAVVERYLEVEVTGFGRDGQPLKIDASGWQARILQHECDHLDGILYVDKMVPRTFRTCENMNLPIAIGCPKLGVH